MDRTQQIKREIEDRLDDLPVLPSIVAKTMELARDQSCGARDLARTISLDGGISAKVLRLANSAYYGFPSQISTITHAVVILGFNAVSNLVLGSAVMQMFGGDSEGALFHKHGLWKHSLGAATAARLLAERLGCPPPYCEQAFIGGLLHDVGKVVLDHQFPEEWRSAVAACHERWCQLPEAELDVLGITHAAVGELAARKWAFAELLVDPIAHHHSPTTKCAHKNGVFLAHAGDYLAHVARMGSSGAGLRPVLDADVRQELKLDDAAETELVEALEMRILDLEEFLHLALGQEEEEVADAA